MPSIRFVILFEMAIHDVEWMGMLPKTDIINVIFPPKDKMFAFHPSSLLVPSLYGVHYQLIVVHPLLQYEFSTRLSES